MKKAEKVKNYNGLFVLVVVVICSLVAILYLFFNSKNKFIDRGKVLPEKSLKNSLPTNQTTATPNLNNMVLIPGGTVDIAGADGRMTTVKLEPYYIDKYPVTAGEFREYMTKAGLGNDCGCFDWCLSSGFTKHSNYPVTYITWQAADKYAKFMGKRLPTEAEWQLAASGEKGNIFPWGNEWENEKVNVTAKNKYPVGQFSAGASPFGLEDMVGNIFHWTCTPSSVSGVKTDKPCYVIKSGSMGFMNEWNRTDFRTVLPEDSYALFLGFRCVKPAGSVDRNIESAQNIAITSGEQFSWNEALRQTFSYELNPTREVPTEMEYYISKLNKGDTVVDIATGIGFLAFRLSEKTGKNGLVYAVDIDRSVLDFIDKYTAAAKITNIKTVLSKDNDILIPANSCDAIFILGALSYIHPEICESFMKSCRNSLKKDGLLVISDSMGFDNVKYTLKHIENYGFSKVQSPSFPKCKDPRYNVFVVYKKAGK